MYVAIIRKIPKPDKKEAYIAYLTNVHTLKEYRNRDKGTELLTYIKEYLSEIKCELTITWPSENSIDWYLRNDFIEENEVMVCRS